MTSTSRYRRRDTVSLRSTRQESQNQIVFCLYGGSANTPAPSQTYPIVRSVTQKQFAHLSRSCCPNPNAQCICFCTEALAPGLRSTAKHHHCAPAAMKMEILSKIEDNVSLPIHVKTKELKNNKKDSNLCFVGQNLGVCFFS